MDTSGPEADQELVARARRGDTEAMEALYRQHRSWVLALARRFTGDADDALDVMQDVFSWLLQQLPRLRLTSSLRAYLFPAVKHRSISLIRKRRPSDPAEDHHLLATWKPPDTDLGRMVATLPDAQREVVELRFVLGFSLPEIAEALEIPTGTVKSRLHHALRKLREMHEEQGAGGAHDAKTPASAAGTGRGSGSSRADAPGDDERVGPRSDEDA